MTRIPLDRLIVAALCGLLWASAHARPPEQAPGGWVVAARGQNWGELSPREQQILHKYRDSWQRYNPDERARLQRGAQRYLKLSPREREQVLRESERYQRLAPQERRQLHQKYKASKKQKNR